MLAPRALQPGYRLGRYELVRFLGEGGFAEVWLARATDDAARGEVAIKLVRRGRVATATERAMFHDEANIAASIRHPNVACVFEIGEEDGVPYLVMEHVSGGSLESVVRGALAMHEPVPVAIAVALIADTCAGLHAAHELLLDGRLQHVVHRDVSPQNVLITEGGVPKLIDFGIAKARERIAKQTSTGVAKGKIAYMSPEQARGEAIDRRADIWAIGAVAFELLEGNQLLSGLNEIARLQQLVNRPVRPTFMRTPDSIAAIVKRALSFRARDRHATADELRVELDQALSAEGLGASAEEIADYCRRAHVAAELAATVVEPRKALDDLLAAHPAVATVSALDVPAPRARTKRAAAVVLASIVGFVAIGIAVRLGAKEREEPPAQAAASTASQSPPVVALSATQTASSEPAGPAVASSMAVASAPPAPAGTTRPQVSALPAKAAPTNPKRTRHPSDYDQIE